MRWAAATATAAMLMAHRRRLTELRCLSLTPMALHAPNARARVVGYCASDDIIASRPAFYMGPSEQRGEDFTAVGGAIEPPTSDMNPLSGSEAREERPVPRVGQRFASLGAV